MIQEAVRVKHKLQWRLQNVGDARNMDHLPRKATVNEWNPAQKTGPVGCSQQDHRGGPAEATWSFPHALPQILNMELQNLIFVFLDFDFAPIPPFFTLIHPSWSGNV
jgi:hypothetical protein